MFLIILLLVIGGVMIYAGIKQQTPLNVIKGVLS